MQKKIAIIDLGSNSIRMIVVKVYEDGAYKMIDQAKEMVRLSEGMGEENILKPMAINRTLNALKLFRKLIDTHKVDETFAIATAAVRNAVNRQNFLDKVELETEFKFDVISGEQEAYYDYMGVINSLRVENCVIIDTGGASTEIIWVSERKMKHAVSIPYGAVVLTERFLENEEMCPGSLKKLEEFIKIKFREISWLGEARGLPVVGLGGSIRTLAKIHKKKSGLSMEGLHNYRVGNDSVQAIYEKVTTSKYDERKNIPGLNKERIDIISGGLVPLKILMEHIGSDILIVSGNGLREGVFFKSYLELWGENENIIENVLYHSLENTLKNYDTNIIHSYHVQKLSLQMFDQLKEVHGVGDNFRELLAVGALLHDIGLYVDYYNHHRHGFYLMLNSRINGLTTRELIICAFITAMHRNEEFKQDWKEYDSYIDKNDYDVIKKLGMLVRIAEELDRNEYGSVESIECRVTKESVRMMLITNGAADLEIAVAMKVDKAFEKLFGRKLSIVNR